MLVYRSACSLLQPLIAVLLCALACSAQSAANTPTSTLQVINGQQAQEVSGCTPTTCLLGVASLAGGLAGCQVVLQSANFPDMTATTSLNGSFAFAVSPSSLGNVSIYIPWNQSAAVGAVLPNGTVYTATKIGDTTYNCADTATDLSPPITLSGLVTNNVTEPVVINAITTAAVQAAVQFQKLPSCYQAALEQSASAAGIELLPISASKVLQLVAQGSDLEDLSEYSALLNANASTDLIDAESAQLYLLNAQIMTAMTLGGVSVLKQGFFGNIDEAVSAIFQQLLSSAAQQLYTRVSHGNTAVAFDLSQALGQLSLTNGTSLASLLKSINATNAANLTGSTQDNTESVCSTSISSNNNSSSSSSGSSMPRQSAGTINSGRRLLQHMKHNGGSGRRQLLLSATAQIQDVRDAIGTIIADINNRFAALVPAEGHINATAIEENTAALLRLAQFDIYDAALSDWLDYADFVNAYTGTRLSNSINTTLDTVVSQAPAFA